MDMFITIAVFLAACYGCYKWAESKGRNAATWAIVAVLISPLITAIILLFVPKTLEKQAEEAKILKSLMED